MSLSGRQELRIWEAGIISDSLIGLLERIFFGDPFVCCSRCKTTSLVKLGYSELALEKETDGMAEINLWDLIVVKLSELGILKRYCKLYILCTLYLCILVSSNARAAQVQFSVY